MNTDINHDCQGHVFEVCGRRECCRVSEPAVGQALHVEDGRCQAERGFGRRRDWLNDDMDTHAHEVQSIFESPPMFANPTAGDAPKKDKKQEKKRKGRISMCMRLMNMRE